MGEQLSFLEPLPEPLIIHVINMQGPMPCHRCEEDCITGWNAMPYYEDYTWYPKEPGTFVCLCDRCFALFDRRAFKYQEPADESP